VNRGLKVAFQLAPTAIHDVQQRLRSTSQGCTRPPVPREIFLARHVQKPRKWCALIYRGQSNGLDQLYAANPSGSRRSMSSFQGGELWRGRPSVLQLN
jgi:hypothetical protein